MIRIAWKKRQITPWSKIFYGPHEKNEALTIQKVYVDKGGWYNIPKRYVRLNNTNRREKKRQITPWYENFHGPHTNKLLTIPKALIRVDDILRQNATFVWITRLVKKNGQSHPGPNAATGYGHHTNKMLVAQNVWVRVDDIIYQNDTVICTILTVKKQTDKPHPGLKAATAITQIRYLLCRSYK